jgi:hypothetical protein
MKELEAAWDLPAASAAWPEEARRPAMPSAEPTEPWARSARWEGSDAGSLLSRRLE